MVWKLSLQAAAIVLIIMVAGAIPVWYFSSQPHSHAVIMLFSGGNCLLMALLGMIPVMLVINKEQEDKIHACRIASALRIVLTAGGAVVVYFIIKLIQPVDIVHFALWTLGFYIALLIWETITTLRILKEL